MSSNIKSLVQIRFIGRCKAFVNMQRGVALDKKMLNNLLADAYVKKFAIGKPKNNRETSDFVNLFWRKMKPIYYQASSEAVKNLYSIVGRWYKFSNKLLLRSCNLNVIKNSSGKIVGGFAYSLRRLGNSHSLHISSMVMDETVAQTKDGLELLKEMGARIKKLANKSGDSQITCSVAEYRKGVVNLYKRMGFKEVGKNGNYLKLSVPTEDFGKGYFE